MTRRFDGAVPDAASSGRDFLHALEAAYRRAVVEGGGVRCTTHMLGSGRLRLHLAGPGLEASVLPAFAHLRTDRHGTAEWDLDVLMFDSASTGITPPRPPWAGRDFQARGEVRHNFGDEIQLSFRIDSGVLSVFDAREHRAVCWVRAPRELPPWEVAAPLRPVLAWWAAATDRQLAHGAAVGTVDGAVLIAARGGSGKSTTALSALESGMLYLGDDYVMLEDAGAPRVASLYCTAKVRPDNLSERLPRLAGLALGDIDPVQDKVTLFLDDRFASQLPASLPLRAIVVPRLAPTGKAGLRRLHASRVLAALAPTTLFQLPGAGEDALRRLHRFVSAVPGYRIDLGTDLTRNVELLRALAAQPVPEGRLA